MASTFPINKYFNTKDWANWKWQEKNTISNLSELFRLFPNLENKVIQSLKRNKENLKLKLTPYLLSLIQIDENGNPSKNDPIWNQFIPQFDEEQLSIKDLIENWEMPNDMINPVIQYKYYNRLNIRIQNNCLGYCMYCFEAKRVLDKESGKEHFKLSHIDNILDYLRYNPQIEEIVLSGGEPLYLSNEKLEKVLKTLRLQKQIKAIRIQTRAFTHNPFRLSTDFGGLLMKYDVTALTFHICHPNEITKDVKKVLNQLRKQGCETMFFAHIPLLKGINDDENTLIKLFMELYSLKIKPYYLIHSMPDTLGARKYRTSVKKGVELMRAIKRNYSNPAVPEYIIVHSTGKHTVPFELSGTSEFEYHNGIIKFRNWKGKWCIYEDVN